MLLVIISNFVMQKLYVYKAVKNETFDLKIEKKMN